LLVGCRPVARRWSGDGIRVRLIDFFSTAALTHLVDSVIVFVPMNDDLAVASNVPRSNAFDFSIVSKCDHRPFSAYVRNPAIAVPTNSQRPAGRISTARDWTARKTEKLREAISTMYLSRSPLWIPAPTSKAHRTTRTAPRNYQPVLHPKRYDLAQLLAA
jgi:hypothetical protein